MALHHEHPLINPNATQDEVRQAMALQRRARKARQALTQTARSDAPLPRSKSGRLLKVDCDPPVYINPTQIQSIEQKDGMTMIRLGTITVTVPKPLEAVVDTVERALAVR